MISDMKSRWDNLAEKLRVIYHEENKDSRIHADLKYLSEAYQFTEKLWLAQLQSAVPKVVMLSEAPLFGESKNYFYKPDTAPSSFFWFDDAKAVAGNDFANGKKFECAGERKQFLIKAVTSNGFLILDLFPYAFNANDTVLNYRNARKELYLRIFRDSIGDHLCKKLDLINEKCNHSNPPLFLFRYKRLKDRLEYDIKGVLKRSAEIELIAGKNMSLDREALQLKCLL
jgi:hypothetical protein